MNIAIQGIKGSYHYQVAQKKFGKEVGIIECMTFSDLVKSLLKGEADQGVLALENSIAGAILPNYELMDRNNLRITGEFYLPISHQLMALKGQTLQDIKEVRSHPMALLQCKVFFENHPHIKLIEDLDTASVAKWISEEKIKGTAAIAGASAAEFYGLEILNDHIQTVKNNVTRFCIVEKENGSRSTDPFNKSSLKIILINEKGSLAKVLNLMSENNLDLTKIQSLPLIDKPWQYAFFIDILFEQLEDYTHSLSQLEEMGISIKVLGEYLNRKE
ncbi:MAG: prephenate dehydratase [Anditalea sp.]